VNAEQNYTYLKGSGCGQIKGLTCDGNSQEFCSKEEMGRSHCYTNLEMKGTCSGSSGFVGQCKYLAPRHSAMCVRASESNHKTFGFESYGAHSRCIKVERYNNTFDAACLRTRCEGGAVQIKFGNEVFTCPAAGGEASVSLSAFQGKVNCPVAEEFCGEFKVKCPYDCHGQGICMADSTCQCLKGFAGKDCNTCAGCKKETDPFVTGSEEKEEEKKDDDKKDEDKKKDDEDDGKCDEKDGTCDEEEKKDKEDEKKEEERDNEDEKREEEEGEKEEEEEEDDFSKMTMTKKAKELYDRIVKSYTYKTHYTSFVYKWKFYGSFYANYKKEYPNCRTCDKWIAYSKKIHDRVQKHLDRVNAQILNDENNLPEHLHNDLTKKFWAKEKLRLPKESEAKIKETMLVFFKTGVARFDKYVDYYEKRIKTYQARLDYYRKKGWKRSVACYERIIARYTRGLVSIKFQIKLFQDEMQKYISKEEAKKIQNNIEMNRVVQKMIDAEISGQK